MLKALVTHDSPFYIQFFISGRCHLRCKMCNIVESFSAMEPFSGDRIEAIADNLVKIGAGVVLLTGGEPFLRDDIADIVRIFKSRHLDVRLQTAGLPARWNTIKSCVDNGARDINVSLDSLDEKLSDYINGVEKSFSKAIQTISFISQTFPRRDAVCALGCVLSRYNVDEIDALLEFATKIGWWLSLVPVHIADPEHPLDFRGYDDHFAFRECDHEKVEALIAQLKQRKKEGATLFDSNDYLDSIVHFVKTGTPSWRHRGICDTPGLYFAINPDGSFAPCCDHRMEEKIFLWDPAFPRIFRSADFRKKVTEIAQRCPGCNFGSYPEMTFSVRSLSTTLERITLQGKASTIGLRPLSEQEIWAIIDDIRRRYPVYSGNRDYPVRQQKKLPTDAVDNPLSQWNSQQ